MFACVSRAAWHEQLPFDPNRKARELSGSLLCVSALNFLFRAPRRIKTNALCPKPPSLNFHLLATTVFKQYVCRLGGVGKGEGVVWGPGRLPPHQNNHLWAGETVSPLPGFPMATADTTPTENQADSGSPECPPPSTNPTLFPPRRKQFRSDHP